MIDMLLVFKTLPRKDIGGHHNYPAVRNHPEWDRSAFEKSLEKTDKPERGFIAPNGDFLRLTGMMHEKHIIDAARGKLRTFLENHTTDGVYRHAFSMGYARIGGVGKYRLSVEFENLTPEQKRTLRTVIPSFETVFVDRWENGEKEKYMYDANESNGMESKRENYKILSMFD